jgi:hypothetical protein
MADACTIRPPDPFIFRSPPTLSSAAASPVVAAAAPSRPLSLARLLHFAFFASVSCSHLSFDSSYFSISHLSVCFVFQFSTAHAV